ncbi:unnamed protein product [Echinostoma caproni]|uniref:Uncharacterized protein n=1 Tax=Echinostoma caproni TaxID=27848 RepID=A0A183AQN4_9TREM|nr:unnamed protein product [Echinostoma caproni]
MICLWVEYCQVAQAKAVEAQHHRQKQIIVIRRELAAAYAQFILLERQIYAAKHRIMYRPVDPTKEAIHDQNLFETTYWFLVFGVWITFGRNYFKDICIEVGKSDMFNSLGRMGAARFSQNPNDRQSMKELYKTHLSRGVMMNQRSPALRLLIPEPRDRVAALFQNIATKTECTSEQERRDSILQRNQRYGILGDARYLYDDQLIANSADGITEQAGSPTREDI